MDPRSGDEDDDWFPIAVDATRGFFGSAAAALHRAFHHVLQHAIDRSDALRDRRAVRRGRAR